MAGPGTRRTGWIALFGAALLPIATPGCSSKVGAARTPPPPVVNVVEARLMTVPVMAEPIGTTRALQEVSIRARVRGFLQEIYFKEGADVKKGQLLFVIDEAPFQAKLADAQAQSDQAEAALKKGQDSKSREVAEAELAMGKAQLALAEVEERREQSLLKRNASSVEDVQRKQALRLTAVAKVDANKASLDQSRADYDTGQLAARADLAGAKARVVEARLDLGYCRMASPIDGRIGMAEVKLGNLVGPMSSGGAGNYTELAVVRQLDPMGVDIHVSSKYLDRVTRLIAQGLPIEVYRPGLEGEEARRFRGKMTAIDNTVDSSTSTFKVRSEVANAEAALLPGDYVKADVKVGELKDVVVVPEQAVVETQAGPTVFSVDPQGKVSVVPVMATITYKGLRVLESGLKPGQVVIVEGMQMVRAGMTVKTETAQAEASGAAVPVPTASDKESKPGDGEPRPHDGEG